MAGLGEKMTSLQGQLDLLPEEIVRCLAQQSERADQRRNFLHPDTAALVVASGGGGSGGGGGGGGGSAIASGTSLGVSGGSASTAHHPLASLSNSPLLPHSRSVPSAPSTMSLHPWPVSPVLPPVSSRTPHLVPETGRHHGLSHSASVTATTSQSATRLTSQAGMGGLGNSQGSDTSAHS